MRKYREEYKWSNIFTMVRNLGLDPEICTDDFRDRLVVITGATSGIGRATAKKFASHGSDILCINRNEEKTQVLVEELKTQFNATCSYMIADFARLADVHEVGRQLATIEREIDVLIHNVGLFVTKRTFTVDNLELVFQTNYLSSFIVNHYIKDKLKEQNSGRIVFVNSEAHRFAVSGLYLDDLAWDKHRYSGLRSYGAAKTAQLLSVIKLDEIFSGTGITVNAMHPGNVRTNSGQNNGWIYKLFKKVFIDRSARSPEVSAEAIYYLGVSPKLENTSGRFFNLTTEEEPAPPALDKVAADELWALSLELGGLA